MVSLDLENCPVSTWLTDGLSEEEIQRIKEEANALATLELILSVIYGDGTIWLKYLRDNE